MTRTLITAIGFCLLSATLSSVAAPQNTRRLPPNEQGTLSAWDALTNGHPKTAIASADRVVDDFKDEAEAIQTDLRAKNAPAPPVGAVTDEKEKKVIFDRGVLNDVATCYYIKGQVLEQLKDATGAKQAYEAACRLTYARTWDPQGWFWDPAKKSCRLANRIH
jgi:hypothetical protein